MGAETSVLSEALETHPGSGIPLPRCAALAGFVSCFSSGARQRGDGFSNVRTFYLAYLVAERCRTPLTPPVTLA